jgi:2-haloacid dehalogenase
MMGWFGMKIDLNRRKFLAIAAAGSIAAAVSPISLVEAQSQAHTSAIKAIAFDGFVIFDPRSVANRVEEVFPGTGMEFTNEWRTRQFEYSWLRTAAEQYADFWQVTEEALNYTARKFKLDLKPKDSAHLMNAYRELSPWPDVPAALEEFRKRGIRLAFLSNFTAAMLDGNLEHAKLRQYFQSHLSTDLVRAYKPSPRAYKMGVEAFKLRREEIAFAAFGAWDAAGAKWFGYPTVWVNRANVPAEELGVAADVTTRDMSGLLNFTQP